MASLYIKDSETAALAAELAAALGTTKTEAVRDALLRRKRELEAAAPKPSFRERLEKWHRENPLPPPTGLKADKAFFDWLNGEDEEEP